MNLRSFLGELFPQPDAGVIRTPFGSIKLARDADRHKVNKVFIGLQRSTDALTRKDLGDWRNAWQRALSVDSPDRRLLYDIYRDVEVDLHLSGCVKQREGFVLAK